MSRLIRESLTADNRHVVRLFCCGFAGVWCEHANEWILAGVDADYGAFYSMRRHHTQVWLYFDDVTNDLVAFGSLGPGTIAWPSRDDPRQECSYIPQMAIDARFHGQPSEHGTVKYCHQLMQDLLLEARGSGKDKLVLHVHSANDEAQGLYARYGFVVVPNQADKYGNLLMMRRI